MLPIGDFPLKCKYLLQKDLFILIDFPVSAVSWKLSSLNNYDAKETFWGCQIMLPPQNKATEETENCLSILGKLLNLGHILI